MPQANSTTSMPRLTSARASASVLPCSRVTSAASSSNCSSQQLPEAKHHAGPLDDRRLGPGRQRRRGRRDDFARLLCVAKRHAGDHLAGRRIKDVAKARRLRLGPLAAPEDWKCVDFGFGGGGQGKTSI